MRRHTLRWAAVPLLWCLASGPGRASADPGRQAPRPGYLLVGSDGGVFAFGAAPFQGSPRPRPATAVVGAAATPSGRGYWLAAADGGVYAFGAPFHGSAGGIGLRAPVVGIAAVPSGLGYRLASADGGVFSFGDASFLGSAGSLHLARPVVAIAATPSGRGYWLVASDGGVFAFGDAPWLGSMGGTALARPIVGIASTPSGAGYRLVASDGGVFSFGDAAWSGSMGGVALAGPVVGIGSSPSGRGYWLAAADGGVFSFGDAPFLGSAGGVRLAAPVGAFAEMPRPAPPDSAIFFYPWHANPPTDGLWRHWEQNGHQPPDDIGADFYPARGAYSNADPAVMDAQVREMAATGVGEVVSSWWGRGSYEDARLPEVTAAAGRHGLDVGIILEPYPGRTPSSARSDIAYARALGVQDVFVYEVLGEDPAAWAGATAGQDGVRIFGHSSDVAGMRSGTMLDRARRAGFDGVFTYNPLLGPADFAAVCGQARARSLLCSPSVAPGFQAQRATGVTGMRLRRAGATYDEQWAGALYAAPDVVTVTSYNEWHEGTQIEPAASGRCLAGGFCYGDYEGSFGRTGAAAGRAYLDRTAEWIARAAQ